MLGDVDSGRSLLCVHPSLTVVLDHEESCVIHVRVEFGASTIYELEYCRDMCEMRNRQGRRLTHWQVTRY